MIERRIRYKALPHRVDGLSVVMEHEVVKDTSMNTPLQIRSMRARSQAVTDEFLRDADGGLLTVAGLM